jgi:tetratricopeptide (TPR) repeat protein
MTAGHEDLLLEVARAQTLSDRQEQAELYQEIVDRANNWLQHETTLGREYRGVLALAAANLGHCRAAQMRVQEAISLERQAIDACRQLIAEGWPPMRQTLAYAQVELALALGTVGAEDEAVELFTEAKKVCEALLAEGNPSCRAELALAHLNLGLGLLKRAQAAVVGGGEWRQPTLQAAKDLGGAVALYEQLVAQGEGQRREYLAGARAGLGTAFYFQSRFEEAMTALRQSIALYEELVKEGREDLRPKLAQQQASLKLVQEDYRPKSKPWWRFWG